MLVFEWTIGLLLGAVILSGIARRLKVPYPALLALGGAGLAFLPHTPQIDLDPQLALALFVAPVLLDAAYDTSLRDLRDNWLPIGSLVVMAVFITTLAVALVAHHMVNGLSWPAAIALGAIVAPPDAAAATAIFRQVKLPHRLLVILEGESLLNDATALLIFRAAVAAVVAGSFHPVSAIPTYALVILLSVGAGWLVARGMRHVIGRVADAPTSIVLQFVSTFGVWMLAERFGLSGILTVVVYGMVIAQTSPLELPARLRVPSFAVWDTVVFVLNVLAFLIIGLQLKPIWVRLSGAQQSEYVVVAIAVLATAIASRFAWVMTYNTLIRYKVRRFGTNTRRPLMPPTIRGGLIISWCGMRGIVTLAAALALPGSEHFPHRDLIVFCAFTTVLGTLLIQGLTLRPLLWAFDLRDDGPVDREVHHASNRAVEAACQSLKGDKSPQAEAIRREYYELLSTAEDGDGSLPQRVAGDRMRRGAIRAARKAVASLRSAGEIGDHAFHLMEERLDLLELSAGVNAVDDELAETVMGEGQDREAGRDVNRDGSGSESGERVAKS